MAEQDRAVATMRAITLSREYGSGGGEVAASPGALVAPVDHEIVARIARELGVTDAAAAVYDEQRRAGSRGSWASWAARGRRGCGGQGIRGCPDGAGHRRAPVPRHAAPRRRGGGRRGAGGDRRRGAQVLLARGGIAAGAGGGPLPIRRAYVARREGLTDAAALAGSRARSATARATCGATPTGGRTTPAVRPGLNTGVLALDSAVELAVLALEHKARQLAWRPTRWGRWRGWRATRAGPAISGCGGCRRAAAAGVTPGPLGRLSRGFRQQGPEQPGPK